MALPNDATDCTFRTAAPFTRVRVHLSAFTFPAVTSPA
jgi:hypothetical protein